MSHTLYKSSFTWRSPKLWNYSLCHRDFFRVAYVEEEQALSFVCDTCKKECHKIAVLEPLNPVDYLEYKVSYQIREGKLFLRLVPDDPDERDEHVFGGRGTRLKVDFNPVFVPRKREHFSLSILACLRWLIAVSCDRICSVGL